MGIEVAAGNETSRVGGIDRTDRPSAPIVQQAVSLFNARHREYAADIQDGVVVIYPRTGRAATLTRAYPFPRVAAPDTETGILSVLRVVDPALEAYWVMRR